MGKLRDQMLADLQLRGATPRTQKTYLREVNNLAKYFNRSPAELGEDELKEYMLYLMKERHLSDLLFRSVSETLMKLASDQKHLGARIEAIGILHAWGKTLWIIPTFTVLSPEADYPLTVAVGYHAAKGSSFT